MSKKPGRPKVTDDPEIVRLLVGAIIDGSTVQLACLNAGISREAFYARIREDPEFSDKILAARHSPTVSARQNVVRAIYKGDLALSKWWLDKYVEPTVMIDAPAEDASSKSRDTHVARSESEAIRATEEVLARMKRIKARRDKIIRDGGIHGGSSGDKDEK